MRTGKDFSTNLDGPADKPLLGSCKTLSGTSWLLAEGWLKRNEYLVVGIVVVLGVMLRIFCFIQLNAGPCILQHRWEQTDMHFFDFWAKEIVAGDWLCNRCLHPFHRWHKDAAEQFYLMYPEQAATIENIPTDCDENKDKYEKLWDHWYRGKCFYQEPLYPYLIAFTYRLFGADVRWVFVWQMVLGIFNLVLIYLIGKRLFGPVVAVVASLLALLYGPLMFFELVLLRSTLITFVSLLLVYLTIKALDATRWRRWLVVGLVFGLAVLLKVTFLMLCLAVLCLLLWRHRLRVRPALLSALVLLAGMSIPVLPLIARNVAVGVQPFAMASANVVTFIFSDAADHRPYAGFNPSAYITPVMAKTDGGLLPTIIETLKTHPNCISYLKQLAGKFNAMWQWYERPNNANFYFYALHSSALRLSLVSFAIIGPLAIAGLVLSARDARRCAVLYLMVAFCIFVMLISYVLARFRVTFAAALLPFAAVAIVRIAEWLLSRRFIYVCLMVGGVILLWFWVTRPLAEGKPLIRYSDYGAAHINYYLPAVENACRQGDLQQAVDILEQSLRYEPRPHRPWTIHDSDIDDEQGRVTDYFVNVHILCADLLRQTGQIKAAERHQKQAIELKNSIERWQHRRSVK